MDRAEEDQVSAAYSKAMTILRSLPWDVREETCAKLLYNPDFCWHCGTEKTPPGSTCHCTNDE
jgi:hypothetical protein